VTPMYRLFVILTCATLFAGCAGLETNNFLSRTGEALGRIGQKTTTADAEKKVRPLFDQPYIDPLTEYIQRYSDDPARADRLEQVKQERDRRCAEVARRYNTDDITRTGLALYRRGYSFSCPEDVAAYEAKLEAKPSAEVQNRSLNSKPVVSDPAPPVSDGARQPADASRRSGEPLPEEGLAEPASAGESQNEAVSRQLNECFLLTRIRNYSAALEACHGPAEDGAIGAQSNMAQIQSALGNHESAYQWARKAAPASAQAANLLGEMYAHGRGVTEENAKAVKWFRTAAELGHAGAQDALDNLDSATADTNGN